MTNLRTAFLATAVGLMTLAAPAFAEVIMTPDGHYYKLVPLKAPPPGATACGFTGPTIWGAGFCPQALTVSEIAVNATPFRIQQIELAKLYCCLFTKPPKVRPNK